MRRCGHNPTDIEVSDIINKIHDDSGSLDLEVRFLKQFESFSYCLYLQPTPIKIIQTVTFQDFYTIMENRSHDTDPETGYKVGFGNLLPNLRLIIIYLLGMFPSFQQR